MQIYFRQRERFMTFLNSGTDFRQVLVIFPFFDFRHAETARIGNSCL
jgi:hypothetical protein